MGLNENVQRLAINEITKTAQKQYKKEYNDNLKYFILNIKELLQVELIEDLKNNINIFDNDYKYKVINDVIDSYFKNNSKIKDKYKNDIQIHFISNYYNISNQARLTLKKQQEQTSQKHFLNDDIFEIKKQREQVKLQIEMEKLTKLQQKQNINAQVQPKSNDGLQAVKIILCILFAPIAIIGLILWGVLSAAAKSK